MSRVSLKNAAAVTDDYFSALLAIGRRARVQRNECLLVNARHSRSALAVIDLATRVFGAKVFIANSLFITTSNGKKNYTFLFEYIILI